jgi:hypothetical protein
MRAALRREPRINPDGPHFAEGYRRGQEYIAYRIGEPEEIRRLVDFFREIEINETIESFVMLNNEPRGRAAEIVARIVLGPHFKADPAAPADWWEAMGGDTCMPNFVCGFLSAVKDNTADDD